MVKQMMVRPDEVRRPETIQLGTIPLNAYQQSLSDEISAGNLTASDAMRIYHDMVAVREFETMLDQIKKMGSYQGIAYDHKGPAHLSIGQEAAAVGQAYLLGVDDHIFGSHRSHGEIIAKGLSAIHQLDDAALAAIVEGYMDGEIAGILDAHAPKPKDTTERAIDFLFYGLLAEIFARAPGFNRGLGGSMHAFFLPFGAYPNNAIVGGSADIAMGSALYKRVQCQPGITVANIGDASSACGPVLEALNFAAMGQLQNLWSEPHRGGLPIIFCFMNNFYGMGGQTRGETMGFEAVACLGAGFNAQNLHAEAVDGNNPLAVIDAFRRKKEIIAAGDGPVLLETITYRQSGHSPSDASAYREREEIDMWRQSDPLTEFGQALLDAGVASESDLEAVQAKAREKMTTACKLATDLEISPRLDGDPIARAMFSHTDEVELPGGAETLQPLAENSRVQAIAKKSRAGIDPETGQILPEGKAISYRDALFETIIHHFYEDPRLVAYGEENRDWDGAFAVYRGMTEALPYHRFFNAPISEGAIVGSAVGYAMEGGRALVELMYCDFLGRAGDEVFNQLPKWQGMSAGEIRMPVVVRVSVGAKYGAQHSQDWSALVGHMPGLKVVFPATPYDAKGLLASALRGNDPVVFFESQRTYGVTEQFQPEVPADYYTLPIGVPDVKRQGDDVTILTIGATLYRAAEAADRLAEEFGISAEIIDARSLVPFDYGPVIESVKKTGKIVLASDACERGSFLATFAANIQQLAFDWLDGPVVTVGARNWITPAAEQEDLFFPDAEWILDAIHAQLMPLRGYTPKTDRSAAYMLRCHREGV